MATDLTPAVNAVADAAHALLNGRPRVLIAVAGPPGAGKTQLAASLARRLNDQRIPALALGLDGWLLDSSVLEARGQRLRRGAPETYDAAGFIHAARRLRAGEEVVAPLHDRARDLGLAGALVLPATCRAVILFGEYLLFDAQPWRDLAPLWDLAVWVEAPTADIRARAIQRWLDQGLSRTAATRRAEGSDVENAQRIVAGALPAAIIVRPDRQ